LLSMECNASPARNDRQIVDAGVPDRARSEVPRGPDHEGAADEEFRAWLHEMNIGTGLTMDEAGPFA
jgi:hypothetical protein